MAKKAKRPELTHCRVSRYAHPKTPWRVWYDADEGGKHLRRAKCFADEDAAWAWAESQDNEITNHGERFGDLPPEARRAYDAFRDLKADLLADGFPVPDFGTIVGDALQAVRLSTTFSAKVRDVADRFLDAKKAEGLSGRHLDNLRNNLDRFCEKHGKARIATITADMIERYLSGLRSPKGKAVGPVTRKHRLVTLRTLWRWAVKRKLAPSDATAAVNAPKLKATRPECYKPEDVARIFATSHGTDPELLPMLALNFFGGLRPSEAAEIDLGSIDFGSDHLRVEVSKTGPRLAFLGEAARAWIAAQPRRTGKAWTGSRRSYHDALAAVLDAAKVDPIHDGGRHSFISYRTAETRNPALVADECGNSANIIRKHYREIVIPDEAQAFFNIRPPVEGGAKVIRLRA